MTWRALLVTEGSIVEIEMNTDILNNCNMRNIGLKASHAVSRGENETNIHNTNINIVSIYVRTCIQHNCANDERHKH